MHRLAALVLVAALAPASAQGAADAFANVAFPFVTLDTASAEALVAVPAEASASSRALALDTEALDVAPSDVAEVSVESAAPVVLDVAAAPAFYVAAARATLRADASDAAPVVGELRRRDGLRVLATDAVVTGADTTRWSLVDHYGQRGYVRADDLSNVWIRVDKSERTTFVYRGAELLRTLPADVSISPEDKLRRSQLGETEHYRMPEGTFFVTRLNDRSQYYRAFVLSYPGPEHAQRGLEAGIIDQATFDAIVAADLAGEEPPMNTRLGGLIEIHGQGSGRRTAWTRGCVALRNVHMDELWDVVRVGTPVVIEP